MSSSQAGTLIDVYDVMYEQDSSIMIGGFSFCAGFSIMDLGRLEFDVEASVDVAEPSAKRARGLRVDAAHKQTYHRSAPRLCQALHTQERVANPSVRLWERFIVSPAREFLFESKPHDTARVPGARTG